MQFLHIFTKFSLQLEQTFTYFYHKISALKWYLYWQSTKAKMPVPVTMTSVVPHHPDAEFFLVKSQLELEERKLQKSLCTNVLRICVS